MVDWAAAETDTETIDDPLQFHFTASHLLEEYSCAAQIYKLTPADMCELARNSVLQSGWEMQVKKHWIGQRWFLPGAAGNDIHRVGDVADFHILYVISTRCTGTTGVM